MIMSYIKDTTISGVGATEEEPLINIPQQIDDDSEIEFFQCQKCSEYNIITSKIKKRRVTQTRHVKVNNVTWASLRRYALINNITMDYALMLLLYNAQTKNIDYLVNERKLVDKPRKRLPSQEQE